VAVGVLRSWMTRPWDAARVGRALAWMGTAALAAWAIISLRWRLAGWRRGRRIDPVRREAGRWLTRLSGPPPVIAELQRLRFGPAPSWPRPSEVFRRARQARASYRR
jgi:hypothetical protein